MKSLIARIFLPLFLLLFASPSFADFNAIVKEVINNESEGRFELAVTYYQSDGSGGGQEAVVDVPYTGLTTDALLNQGVIDAIVADATTTRGYTSFTAANVKSTGFPYPTFHEAFAGQGIHSDTIDGLTVGDHLLYTNNSGRTMLVMQMLVVTTAVSGSGSNPSISLGKTSPDYNDVMSNPSLNGMNSVNRLRVFPPDNDAVLIAPGQSLYLRVSTGGAKTEYDFVAVVRGLLMD